MSINLVKLLVEITAKLELEPVLLHLRAKEHLTKEECDEIRNPNKYSTPALRIEELVEHVGRSEARLQGFLDALLETKQDALLKLINPVEEADNDDADSGKTPPGADSVKSSERSRLLREKKWTCEGLPGAGESCGFVGNWQEAFRWCSHKDCRRYLCSSCIESGEHKHSSKRRLDVKPLHAAAYKRVKKDDAKMKEELCAIADDVGKKISEALKSYLLKLWDRQAPLRSFKKHLLVDMAGPLNTTVTEVSSNQALAAVTKALAQMGVPPPTEEDVVPSVLKDAEPRLLLARLLAEGGHVETFLENLEELEAPPEARRRAEGAWRRGTRAGPAAETCRAAGTFPAAASCGPFGAWRGAGSSGPLRGGPRTPPGPPSPTPPGGTHLAPPTESLRPGRPEKRLPPAASLRRGS